MINNYIKTAWRNLLKQKLFSSINILGLAIGIAVSFFIMSYVSYEFSYDNFHQKKDRIYRVESRFYEGSQLTDDWATSTFGYGSAMKKEIPGIEDFVRLSIHKVEQVVIYKDTKIRESGITYTEPSFFKIFDFKLKEGDKTTALSKPNSVVVTQSAARHFFGNESAMGKTLRFATGEKFVDCIVTGVMEDFPVNSHISFNYLIAYEGLPVWMKDFWYLHEVYTYVLLKPGVATSQIESAFPAMAEKYKTLDALKNKKWAITLVPLGNIHLSPQKANEMEIKGNKNSLVTLMLIALIILLMAWINYINLTMARSAERSKEVGIRKVSGALRSQLIIQFLIESLIINLSALFLASILVILTNTLFNQLIGKGISYFLFKVPLFWGILLSALLSGILISAFYPAFILSSYKPALILKGKFVNSNTGIRLQKSLVVFQFSAALFLMIGLFILKKQISFMQEQNLGVNINRTLVMKYPVSSANLYTTVEQFAEKLKTLPESKAVTVSGSVPGIEVAKFASNSLYGSTERVNRLYEMLTVDYDFATAFDLKLVAGRFFKKGFGDEKNNLLINEAVLPQLGFTKAGEAIGKKVLLEGDKEPVEIIGVIKNWHQRGLGNIYTPIMFVLNGRISWVPPQYISIKLSDRDLTSSAAMVESVWKKYFPESSYDSFFLDSFFNEQYKSDVRFGKIISFFTALAFFITIMGVWALSAYTAQGKVKEVGIRKVYGAGIKDIFRLFSLNITILIGISFLIAAPISYLLMNVWLNHYAFRTNISPWIYVSGFFIALFIVLITVIWQTFLVTVQNPIKSLRTE